MGWGPREPLSRPKAKLIPQQQGRSRFLTQSPAWSSCLPEPLNLHDYPRQEQAAHSPTAGHWQNGLYQPFVPVSASLPLHIQDFSPARASLVLGTRGSVPGNSACLGTQISREEMGTSTGTEAGSMEMSWDVSICKWI